MIIELSVIGGLVLMSLPIGIYYYIKQRNIIYQEVELDWYN